MFPFVSPPLMPVPLLVRGRHCHPISSSHVETHSSPPALPPLATCTAGRTPLRPGAQLAVINQGQSLLCCASCPCSSWFVARACQHPTTISVAIIHTHIHTHMDGSPTCSRPGALQPLARRTSRHGHTTPLSLSVYVCSLLICLLCIVCSPHLPHCPCCRTLNVLNQTFNQAPSRRLQGEMYPLPPFYFSGGWDKRVWHPPLPSAHLSVTVVGARKLAAHNTEAMQSCWPCALRPFAARHLNARARFTVPRNSLLHHKGWARFAGYGITRCSA
jgi:hypothetical protein